MRALSSTGALLLLLISHGAGDEFLGTSSITGEGSVEAGCFPGYETGCDHWEQLQRRLKNMKRGQKKKSKLAEAAEVKPNKFSMFGINYGAKTVDTDTQEPTFHQPARDASGQPKAPNLSRPKGKKGKRGRTGTPLSSRGSRNKKANAGSRNSLPGGSGFDAEAPVPVAEGTYNTSTLCASARKVNFQLVHVPKAGGMTLCCSFKSEYKTKITGCAAASPRYSLQGNEHDTYYEMVKERGCSNAMYEPRGKNCRNVASGLCQPMILMMAHPVDRYFAAFFQKFGVKDKRANECGFLNCNEGSQLAQLYRNGQITPSEYALWRDREALTRSFNEATKFLGANNLFHGKGKHPVAKELKVTKDRKGREMLERATQRMAALDFVGLTSRFTDSMELMSWQLGIPIQRFCSCNINAFKTAEHRNSSTMTPGARARVAEDNSLDIELYEVAARLFHERFEAYKGAVGSARRPFRCNVDRTVCRAPAAHGDVRQGDWMSSLQYKSAYSKAIAQGKHSFCSFTCTRAGPKSIPTPDPLNTNATVTKQADTSSTPRS